MVKPAYNHEALFGETLPDGRVRCGLCPHQCRIRKGHAGLCGVRENQEGTLVSTVYGRITSYGLDHIEKKPLNRFHPGSLIFSIGSAGCNFSCPFCQNYRIARTPPDEIHASYIAPEELVDQALSLRLQGNIGIAYTYNEPTVWYEYMADTAQLANRAGLFNVMVTNGFIEPKPLDGLLDRIDAFNIDLKSFQEPFYKNVVHGALKPVQETIRRASQKAHVEVTTLVIPGLNDSPEEIEALSSWLASVSPEIPLHLSRFFPTYQMTDRLPTSIETINKLIDIARSHLHYVYGGNMS